MLRSDSTCRKLEYVGGGEATIAEDTLEASSGGLREHYM
jgi:hypothetical protein